MNSYSEAIKYLRGELALSQSKLAFALGTTANTVMRWETGRNVPTPEMLKRIEDKFNVRFEIHVVKAK